MSTRITRRAVISLAALALPSVTFAQANDPITIVVPYPPGSAPDLVARIISTKAGAAMGRTIVVDNRPGANAIIGSDYVSKAKPDGKTLLLVDRMTIVANPLLYAKLPYDPKALEGVSDVARVNLILSVRSSEPYKNWAEFVAYAKANPGKISIGSGGPGSVHHISLELLKKTIGADILHVPYKGIAPAVQDMLAGQLSGVISGPEVIRPHMGGGKIRVIAAGGEQRSSLLPEVPTLQELGVREQILLPTTFTLFAPPGTPEAAVAPLTEALRVVMQKPEVIEQLAQSGLVPVVSTPQQIKSQLEALAAEIGGVIRDANIHLN